MTSLFIVYSNVKCNELHISEEEKMDSHMKNVCIFSIYMSTDIFDNHWHKNSHDWWMLMIWIKRF